jgi:hypothetical protein
MIKIQDVTVPTKGVGKYFQITALNFVVSPTNGIQTYWQVFAETTDEEGQSQPGSMLIDGNLPMDQDTYDSWGTDDSVIVTWALNELGFTAA